MNHTKVLSFEVLISDPNRVRSGEPQAEKQLETTPEAEFDKKWEDAIVREIPLLDSASTPVSCWAGHEVDVDVILPDRCVLVPADSVYNVLRASCTIGPWT